MPNWKKVVVSGSRAELSSVFAPSITGSLLGTSSYAIFAETASFSNSASDVVILCLNQAGFTIPKGAVVRITGSNNASDIPRITTASYEDDNNSANTLGIASQQITNGSQGLVITEGILKGIDTDAFQPGQLLYLGTTGSIIGTAPLAPLHNVRLGEVIRKQSNNGSIYVRIDNGYEIEELHDVRITSASSGDLLVRSGSIWINSKQLTGSYALTGSLILSSSTSGDLLRITQTGTGNALVVEDSANPDATPFIIDATGRVGIGTTTPNFLIQAQNSQSILWYDPTSLGGNFVITASTGLPRISISTGASGSKPSTGFQLGMRTWSDTSFPGYGARGDSFFYAGDETNGFNIINQGPGTNTDDYIRFFAGRDANNVPDIHIQGSGSFRGNVGIKTTTPTLATLQVNGNVFANSYTGSFSGSLSGTASLSETASYVNTLNQNVTVSGSVDVTNRVAASIFMHPKTITENVTVIADYNALLISPVVISGSITIESNADLFIIN